MKKIVLSILGIFMVFSATGCFGGSSDDLALSCSMDYSEEGATGSTVYNIYGNEETITSGDIEFKVDFPEATEAELEEVLNYYKELYEEDEAGIDYIFKIDGKSVVMYVEFNFDEIEDSEEFELFDETLSKDSMIINVKESLETSGFTCE